MCGGRPIRQEILWHFYWNLNSHLISLRPNQLHWESGEETLSFAEVDFKQSVQAILPPRSIVMIFIIAKLFKCSRWFFCGAEVSKVARYGFSTRFLPLGSQWVISWLAIDKHHDSCHKHWDPYEFIAILLIVYKVLSNILYNMKMASARHSQESITLIKTRFGMAFLNSCLELQPFCYLPGEHVSLHLTAPLPLGQLCVLILAWRLVALSKDILEILISYLIMILNF